MKTIFIYDQCCQEDIKFFILDGDYSHLDKIYINESSDTEEEEQKQLEILDEAEHLGTLTTIQWLIYPLFKTIEQIFEKFCGGCKKEYKRIPHPDAKNRPMKGEWLLK